MKILLLIDSCLGIGCLVMFVKTLDVRWLIVTGIMAVAITYIEKEI